MTEVDVLPKRFVSKENETGRWLSPVQTDCRVCVTSVEYFVSSLPHQHRQTGPTPDSAPNWPSSLLCGFVPLLPSLRTDKHYNKIPRIFFPPTWWNQFVGYLIVSSRMLNRRVFSSFVLPDLGLEYFCRRYCPPSTL